MPAERPSIPPAQKMVREISLPDHTVGFFSETLSRQSARYQSVYPIKRGTPYSSVQGGDQKVSDSFAPLYFLKEARVAESDTWVIWSWGTDQASQDVSNASVEYSGEAVAAPIYVRVYTIRRDLYDATPTIPTGTALTALIAIKVTAGGTGYARTDTVNIAGGLGASAELVVDENGVIKSIIVTNGGAGYDSAALPAITFTTSTGSGGTATAIVQPKTAVLVSQKKQELGHDSSFTSQSTDSPYSSHYCRVIRYYETLPGPWIPFTRYDNDLGPIQGRRRAVLNTGQAAALTAIGKITYEGRDGSSIVSLEIEENWSNGTGGVGNPVYPINVTDFFDTARGAVNQTTQLSTDLTSDGSITNVAGVITEIRYDPYNEFLRKKTIETYAVTGTLLSGKVMADEAQGALSDSTSQLLANAAADHTITFKTLAYSDKPATAVTKQRDLLILPDAAFPIIYDYDSDPESGASIVTSFQVVAVASAGAATNSGGVYTHYKRINKWRSLKIIEDHSAATAVSFDEQRFMAFPIPALIDIDTYVYTDGCGTWYEGAAGNSVMVEARTHTSFTTTKQTITGLVIQEKSLHMGRVQLQGLMDSGSFVYTGTCAGTINFGGSDPDFTTYTTTIADSEQLVSGESAKWAGHGGLYKNTELYVTFPTPLI